MPHHHSTNVKPTPRRGSQQQREREHVQTRRKRLVIGCVDPRHVQAVSAIEGIDRRGSDGLQLLGNIRDNGSRSGPVTLTSKNALPVCTVESMT